MSLVSIIARTGYADTPAAPETVESTRLDRCHLYLSGRVLRLAESINNVIAATVR